MKFKPPSTVIGDTHKKATKEGRNLSRDEVTALARKVLLSEDDVGMWIKHLQDVKERRKEGAKKPAATRKAKRANTSPLDAIKGKNEYSERLMQIVAFVFISDASMVKIECEFHYF